MSQLKSTWWRPATAALLLTVAAALWLAVAGSTHAGADDGSVSLDPTQADVGVGGTVDVDVVIDPPTEGLSIWIVQIAYDPAVVRVKDNGGNPMCDTLNSPGGGIAFAAGCATKDTNADSIHDTVVAFGGWVENQGGDPHGFESTQTVATITFQALGAAGTFSALTVQPGAALNFLGPNGETPVPAITSGRIDIIESTGNPQIWGDVNCNGTVDAVDSLRILRADAGFVDAPPANCPGMKAAIVVTGFTAATVWGDGNCNTTVDAIDSLRTLRADAGFVDAPPANCPAMKAAVTVSS